MPNKKNIRIKVCVDVFWRSSVCSVAYGVRRTIYCIKYIRIFPVKFIYKYFFFRTTNAPSRPNNINSFLFHWCLYWLTILRQNNKWVSLWKRDRKKSRKITTKQFVQILYIYTYSCILHQQNRSGGFFIWKKNGDGCKEA